MKLWKQTRRGSLSYFGKMIARPFGVELFEAIFHLGVLLSRLSLSLPPFFTRRVLFFLVFLKPFLSRLRSSPCILSSLSALRVAPLPILNAFQLRLGCFQRISPFGFRVAETTVEQSSATPLNRTVYHPECMRFTPAALSISLFLTASPRSTFASIWIVFMVKVCFVWIPFARKIFNYICLDSNHL